MQTWSTDGTEPIYLCEEHAKQVSSSRSRAALKSVGGYEEAEAVAEFWPLSKSRDASPAGIGIKKASAEPPQEPTKTPQSQADRCAAIDRQISDLASQVDKILSESEAKIDVASTIDLPLEQAILGIIGNPEMSDAQKDSAITRLGEIQRELKQNAGANITLLEAHRIEQSLAACLNSEIGLPVETKAAYRAVHDRMREAIHAALSKDAHSLVSV